MMIWQLVALATQLRNASGLLELDELFDDEELAGPHMFIKAARQLALPLELELEDDPARHVPHLAMMLSTACSHLELVGQPVTTNNNERTNPKQTNETARFMRHPHENCYSSSISSPRAGPP